MLLLVDAGNTRIKWANAALSVQPGQWLASAAVAHEQTQALSQAWQGLPITRIHASNVAGEDIKSRLETLCAQHFPTLSIQWLRSQAQLCKLQNTYRDPGQLGTDRFAGLIAARTLFPAQAVMICNCGTATTIDALAADGRFLGGMILPGLTLMKRALFSHTAQLPQVIEAGEPPPIFADNTDDAIRSGSISAVIGAIEHACAAHSKQAGAISCILSGGAAPAVARLLARPHQVLENLVLIGLHVVANSDQNNLC